ncbi:MAG: hypothetical protein ACQEWM_00115 [Actinomycetota bacterium]
MTTARLAPRATAAIGLAVAMTMVGAAGASAHHCYRDQWSGAAYEHHLRGGTPWVPLSDLGAMFLIPPELQDECGYVADDAVAQFMADNGMPQEPLIHSRATVGSGAAYQGKDVRPFSYLTEEQFGALTMDLMERLELCAAG